MKTDTKKLMDALIAESPIENQQILDEIRAEKAFAREIKQARLDHKMDQKTLAEKTGMKQADISRIENGITIPTIKTVIKILASLGKELAIVNLKETESKQEKKLQF